MELGPPTPSPSNRQGHATALHHTASNQATCAILHLQRGSTVFITQPSPAHCRTQKLNSPHRLPTKRSVSGSAASAPALPHPTRLALPSQPFLYNPSTATTVQDYVCVESVLVPNHSQDSSSPILSSHIPRLPERRTAR